MHLQKACLILLKILNHKIHNTIQLKYLVHKAIIILFFESQSTTNLIILENFLLIAIKRIFA